MRKCTSRRNTSFPLGRNRDAIGVREQRSVALFALIISVCLLVSGTVLASDRSELVGEFEIHEPLGRDWQGDWITEAVQLDTAGRSVPVSKLRVRNEDGIDLPRQFYEAVGQGELLSPDTHVRGQQRVKVLTSVNLKKDSTQRYKVVVVDRASSAPRLEVDHDNGRWRIENGCYRAEGDTGEPVPLNVLQVTESKVNLARFEWPPENQPSGVKDTWLEKGPARAILERQFRFEKPEHRYRLRLTFWAGDPWIGVVEDYALGEDREIVLDLRPLEATRVYHPHTYSPRTFSPGGEAEDSTLQPPQHPIATLAPIWRDIWYGGGPFAFVYNEQRVAGLGIAAVNGSHWDTPAGVSLPSQSIEVHGDEDHQGRVQVRFPTGAGRRHWALIAAPPERRKEIGTMIRAHNDVPLDHVLDEWVLQWESDGKKVDYEFAHQWYGYFNKHILNPTTFPRRVRSYLNEHFEDGRAKHELKSRDLAALAYIFMNPDYWPGPEKGWGNVGNPNFHTDMYNVPLKIGLLMPDHPHSRRWVEYGVQETKQNLYRDSYPGGAWAESLSYSSFFFDVADNCQKLRKAGAAEPFRKWSRLKEVATYLAAMHTPVDPRYLARQKAPIGDTHPGHYVDELNRVGTYYEDVDDRFAKQLQRFPEPGSGALDISSRYFPGFGAMLRGNAYDRRHESFVTVKAGPARNHFQGDELSLYFAAFSTPLAIDYACHYSPRPWHAAMHNRPDMNNKRPVSVAFKQTYAESAIADVFVADEKTRLMSGVPVEPHHTHKPGWEYPRETLPAGKPWVMRRYAMLVKHNPSESDMPDYLVVRDEIDSPEPVWWNLHVLGRDIERHGNQFTFAGQLGVDLSAHVLSPSIEGHRRRFRSVSPKR
ncbi:MAG: hypothetical protein R6U98_32300 [Pirellulaceae bacterium]